jgi:hypothetical protein
MKSQASFMVFHKAHYFPFPIHLPTFSDLAVRTSSGNQIQEGIGTLQSPQPQALLESKLLALRLCRVSPYWQSLQLQALPST